MKTFHTEHMKVFRTKHRVEQPTSKDGLVWTSNLNLSGDHPEGIVEAAGQCHILDSDGLVMRQYRELEDRPVSGKVIRRYSHSIHSYLGRVLELTTPKGWIPQNVCLHVITPADYPRVCWMELYCDFRIEDSKKEDNTVGSSEDSNVSDTLFHSCKFVNETVSSEYSIELELPYEYHSHRIAIVSTLDPEDQPYVHRNAQLSPSLGKRNEYLLRLVTAPGVTVSDVRHRLDQDGDLLIQVDVHRPEAWLEKGTVNPWTPKQLIKEIYANRDRKIDEILQHVNNYFIRCVREKLTTDTDLKLVLESPVTKDLVHRLYHTLTDAGYDVEISDEKLNFTVELPPIE